MPALYKTANIKNNNNNKYIWPVQVSSPSELTADLFLFIATGGENSKYTWYF